MKHNLLPLLLLAAVAGVSAPLNVRAAPTVNDITPTNVTTRSFSIVWAANEAVTAATLTLFADAAGTNDVTATLPAPVFISPAAAATNGIVQVMVTGLANDTTVCFQTRTTAASGATLAPAAAPFPCFTTETDARLDNDNGEPILNDLVRFDILATDQTSPLPGALLVLDAPGLSSHPVSTFVGEALPPPTAVANLRNVFDAQSHTTADIGGNEVLGLRAFRGLANGSCTLENQGLFHFRRAPQHEEVAALGVGFSDLEEPTPCFFADTVCDDRVDILDVQRVLNQFNQGCGGCQFNGDLDVVDDCTINILDVQSVLNRFGQSAPFPP